VANPLSKKLFLAFFITFLLATQLVVTFSVIFKSKTFILPAKIFQAYKLALKKYHPDY